MLHVLTAADHGKPYLELLRGLISDVLPAQDQAAVSQALAMCTLTNSRMESGKVQKYFLSIYFSKLLLSFP